MTYPAECQAPSKAEALEGHLRRVPVISDRDLSRFPKEIDGMSDVRLARSEDASHGCRKAKLERKQSAAILAGRTKQKTGFMPVCLLDVIR